MTVNIQQLTILFYRYLREAHDRTTRCYAPVDSALAGLAFSCQLPEALRAALPTCFYREDAKGSAAHSVRDRLTALLRSVILHESQKSCSLLML